MSREFVDGVGCVQTTSDCFAGTLNIRRHLVPIDAYMPDLPVGRDSASLRLHLDVVSDETFAELFEEMLNVGLGFDGESCCTCYSP